MHLLCTRIAARGTRDLILPSCISLDDDEISSTTTTTTPNSQYSDVGSYIILGVFLVMLSVMSILLIRGQRELKKENVELKELRELCSAFCGMGSGTTQPASKS